MAENKEKRLNIKDLNDVVTVDELASFMGATPRMVTNMVMAGPSTPAFTPGTSRASHSEGKGFSSSRTSSA